MNTSTTPSRTTLHFNDVIGHIFNKHKDQIGKYLSGTSCIDPDTAGQAKRNNFWQWVCKEYKVTNGCMLWLDIRPIIAPAWVNNLFALIHKEYEPYIKGGEIRLLCSW